MDHVLGQEEIKFLKELQEFLPSAIIAGGAVRDMLFDKPYKDLDVFVHYEDQLIKDYGPAFILDDLLPEEFPGIMGVSSNDPGSMGEININMMPHPVMQPKAYQAWSKKRNQPWLSRYFTHNDRLINLVFVPDKPVDYVTSFDINCVQLFHNGNQVHTLPNYKKFVESNYTVDVTGNIKNVSAMTLKRLGAVKAKYPEWKLHNRLLAKMLKGFDPDEFAAVGAAIPNDN